MDDKALKNTSTRGKLDASWEGVIPVVSDESKDITNPFVSENTSCDKSQTSARPTNRRHRGNRKVSDVQGAHAQSCKDDKLGQSVHPSNPRCTGRGEETTLKETTNRKSRRSHGGNRKVKPASGDENDKLHKTEHPWKPRCLQSIDQAESGTSPQQTPDKKTRSSHDDDRKGTQALGDEGFILHKAEHPWKPRCPEQKELTEEEELFMLIRGLLNKLTPQKFQRIISLLKKLRINSEQKLKGFVDLVFEKASSEQLYSAVHANACQCLSMYKVKSEHKEGKMVNFRALLLERCQKEVKVCTFAEVMQEDLEKLENENERLKLKNQIEERNFKMKSKLLGTVRFVGELFKIKLITQNIIHDVIFKLLKAKSNMSLECVCVLWTAVGKELDVENAKPRIDQYFKQMTKITRDQKRSGRIRCLLLNVIDLRTNKWIPLRPEKKPKTIDQIHKEVEQERQGKEFLSIQSATVLHKGFDTVTTGNDKPNKESTNRDDLVASEEMENCK